MCEEDTLEYNLIKAYLVDNKVTVIKPRDVDDNGQTICINSAIGL